MGVFAYKVLRALASLKITVVLFAMAVFIVFAGTVAQIDLGVWTIVDDYFRCAIAWIPLRIFFPRTMTVPSITFPFPGGWLIGGALLINILAAHSVRFKMRAKGATLLAGWVVLLLGGFATWLVINGTFDRDLVATEEDAYWRVLWRLVKGGGAAVGLLLGCVIIFRRRAGIVLLHMGIILMLSSEIYTHAAAVEAEMRIPEGRSSNWVYDTREAELAVIDPRDPEANRVVVVAERELEEGATIRSELLPFDVEILEYYDNSDVVELPAEGVEENMATRGVGLRGVALERAVVSGTDPNQKVDAPSAYIRLLRKDGEGDRVIGVYLVSTLVDHIPNQIEIADIPYDVTLRFKRTYKPYSIELLDFTHERYVGTETPKDFSSVVRLVDPEKKVDKELKIWMNNPLRYAGETFYQASYWGDRTTILQVVRNGGWMIPYVSCMIVLTGMLAQFGLTLFGFLRRRTA